MLLTLAAASLRRHPVRTALAVLGVAVSAALLLDMVMLSTGMRESFRGFLLRPGFQLPVAPKGTPPFDSAAPPRAAGRPVPPPPSHPPPHAAAFTPPTRPPQSPPLPPGPAPPPARPPPPARSLPPPAGPPAVLPLSFLL